MGAGSPKKNGHHRGEFPALTFRQNESGDCQIVDCVPVYIPDVGAIIYIGWKVVTWENRNELVKWVKSVRWFPGRLKMPVVKNTIFLQFFFLFIFFLRLRVSPGWMSRPQTAMFQLEWLAIFKWRANGWRSASLSPYGVQSASFCISLPHQSNTTVSFDTTLHWSPERLLVERNRQLL